MYCTTTNNNNNNNTYFIEILIMPIKFYERIA